MSQAPKYITNIEIDTEEKENPFTNINSSNYDSIVKDMSIGLTAYESVCSPREISDLSKINFTQDQINKVIEEVLRCNICYDIFQSPVSVKGCLHKFCKSCIMDYYFKIKKECAICRHPIETKRLLKDDTKIKEVIDCFIPDQNKFKDEEDKMLAMKAKEFVFRDEQRHLHQIEKNKNNDENELSESKLSNIIDQSSNSRSHHHLLNKKTNRENINNSHIKNNNKDKDKEKDNKDLNEENKYKEIIIRIICDEKDAELKKYFKYTRMKVETNYTLEFISRFICYKQNFKYDQIKKINFYTLEDNSKKKEWRQNDKISDVVNFDAKITKNNNKLNEEKQKESFYSHLYHLYLYFYID